MSSPDGVLPGATVTATDQKTGKSLTVVTSESGSFRFQQLEFGDYRVTVTAAGFKTFIASDVKIDIGREYSLNPQLEVGQVTEEVTVVAGAEAINSTNAELSTTISQEQIKELPLNGRNPLSLLNLIAGANATTSSINGQRSSSTDYRRDGLNVQDNYIRTGGFVSDQPTVDDTAEFTVTTQNAGVETGGGSSQVQLVTPRGGKEFHGALYAFNRNSEFTANSFFNNLNGIDKPFLNRNQYGGSISGQVPFFNFGEGGPMFVKDKAFFFFNYEAFRLAQQVTATGTTLLPAARNGNFTYVNSAGQQVTINVLSGTGLTSPLTTAQGGVLTVDPIIQSRLLNNLPTEANGVTTGINFTQNTSFLRKDPRTRNSYTGRFDYDINDLNTFNFVYRRNDDTDARTDIASGFSPIPFVNTVGPTDFFAAAYRTTIGSRFTNEIRGGFQDSGLLFDEGDSVPDDFLIGNLLLVTNPEGTFRTQGRNTKYRNIQDNASYIWGNHSFRFGGQAEFQEAVPLNYAGTTPTLNISTAANPNTPGLTATQVCGTTTCINTTDLARANTLRYLLGGIIGGATRTVNLASIEQGYTFGPAIEPINYEIYSAYVSDQWRIRPELTLNLGLRYELYTPINVKPIYLEPIITDPDNIAASIINPNGGLQVIGGNVGKPGQFNNPDKDNFAPSISFAYAPKLERGLFARLLSGNTVLRGGFRINYVNDEYLKSPFTLGTGNAGLGSQVIQARDANGLTTVRSSLTPRPGFDPLPDFTVLPTLPQLPMSFAQFNANAGNVGQLFGVDPNLQLGRVYEWNIGIQREIGWGNVLELRYVGNRSNDLIRTVDYNEVDIRNNGFLNDFIRAQGNLAATDAERTTRINACVAGGGTVTTCTNQVNTSLPRSAAFNAAVPGTVQLPVISLATSSAAVLRTSSYITLLEAGQAGGFAQNLILQGLRGGITFQPNPNLFISEIVSNAGRMNYNALQAEIRRRFKNGLSYQVNYTFQKTLTDIPDDSQNRQGEVQENSNPDLNYGRPDYDRTHTINANMIYELPFGKGKRFLNQGGWVNLLFGGFQFSSIVNLSSGPPLAIIDPRSTSSINFKSGRQSATSTLTAAEIKKLTGVFDTPNGKYFIDPKVLCATATAPGQPTLTCFDLYQALPAGYTLSSVRGANPIGQAPFPGQVFFFNKAGEVGNLPRNFLNGLPYLNWDAGLSKNIRFTETMRLQLRAEAFNVLNVQVPFFSADLNVNSTSFGRICSTSTTCTYNTPRILQFGARFDF
ncbi:MAG TPA: TonB-dependent receptor [Pyrinomonadaceae bacterium]|nr:TonB-dependent receptor [Pyrinomonadaceae bacterium]